MSAGSNWKSFAVIAMTRGGDAVGGLVFVCLVCSSCVDREESRMYAGVANTSTAAMAIKSVTRMLYLTTPAPVEIAARSKFDSALPRSRKCDANGRCRTHHSSGEVARRRPNKGRPTNSKDSLQQSLEIAAV